MPDTNDKEVYDVDEFIEHIEEEKKNNKGQQHAPTDARDVRHPGPR